MTYSSPKTLRRRQQAAENKPARKPRRAQVVKPMTDAQWSATCDGHIACIREWQDKGGAIFANTAGRHARTLVHMAIQRRAYQIMADFGRAYWKAMDIARHELLNGEVA